MKTDQECRYIHCTKLFRRRLGAIRKTDAIGALAAQKAEAIIDYFINGLERIGVSTGPGSLTKRGELRVKKCQKYDLGGGYRLIVLRRKNCLHIMYIGTHDECNRWLEHHRGLSDVASWAGEIFPISTDVTEQSAFQVPLSVESEDTTDMMVHNLPDRELRILFSGLVSARLENTS